MSDSGAMDASDQLAEGVDGAGAVSWAYYAAASGPRVELIDRTLKPMLELLYRRG